MFLLSTSRLFVDFCDGWKVGTTCGYEILFSVRENGRGNSCNAWNSLRGSCTGENTSLRVVFLLQEWWIVTCRPTLLRATLDLPNGWKHRDNLWTDLGRPSQNKWRSCWFVWCVLQFLPTDFELGIANENSCSKIRASRAHGWSKAVLSGCVPWIERTLGNRPWPFFEGHYSWRKLVLSLRPRDVLRGKRFADVEEVKKKTTEALKGITLKEFQDCFKKLKTRLDRCIASNGQYFEGDWICNT